VPGGAAAVAWTGPGPQVIQLSATVVEVPGAAAVEVGQPGADDDQADELADVDHPAATTGPGPR
jgi:hypothetical protein